MKQSQCIPELFQEIVSNDDKRKKLIRNMLVPFKEYKELKSNRQKLQRAAEGLYAPLGESDGNKRV